ncbi:MAG: hypothetical protein GY867_09320 [bacterium]|nr:hypothetical protein [bacterium]
MKSKLTIFSIGLLLLLAASFSVAQSEETVDKYSLWLGGYYADSSDYAKKAGEYRLLENAGELVPSFKFGWQSLRPNSSFDLDVDYLDEENIVGRMTSRIGDRYNFDVQYRSLSRQLQQDLLTNMETREAGGGKILTHDLMDAGADYSYHRREILSKVSLLLQRDNNVRFTASHRSILKSGEEQAIASNHCLSCHLTSKSQELESSTHQFQAGIDAEVSKYDVGYQFGFRMYESHVPAPSAYYDEAKHPVNGGSGVEFAPRQLYDDTTLAFSAQPKTEKMSHKLRLKGDLGKGKFAGSLSYSRSENKYSELTSNAWVGAFNYAVTMNPQTRFIARLTGVRREADDPFIDVRDYRVGRTTPSYLQSNFDYERQSSLDRADGKITAEVIRRLNPKMTLSVLAGYNRVDRYSYPDSDDNLVSGTFIGQAKLNYRKGLKYRSSFKYRFEKTSDPFNTFKGLFEERGREILTRNVSASPFFFIFYWEREALKYQNITTEPTDLHEFAWKSTWRPTLKTSVNLGLNAKFDKNGDLDSLDVKHSSFQPHLSLTTAPNPKWSFTAGLTLNSSKSRGPVTVALFDG